MNGIWAAPVVALSIFFVAAGAALALNRAAAESAEMPCVGPRTNAIGFHEHPRHCLEYRNNETFSFDQLLLNRIRWRQWGSARATAKANIHYCAMGGCVNRPAKVAVYGLRSRCGHFTYTRMRVKIDRSGVLAGHVYHLGLPVCRTSVG
jgi:hypothetical protein